MSTRSIIAFTAVVLTIASPMARADVNETVHWENVAIAALQEALSKAHPSVSDWIMTPRVSSRQLDRMPAQAPVSAQVIRLGSRSAVRVEWDSPQKYAATVWFAAQGMKEVVVAARDISAGAALEPTSATLTASDVMSIQCDPLTVVEGVVGMRAAHALREGLAICREDIEQRPPVARGDRVRVSSRAGRVVVTSTAIAEADGQIGDLLKVRNASTRSTYVARVVGEQQVIVHD